MSSEIENLIKEARAAGLARADKVLAVRKSAEEEANSGTPASISGASIESLPMKKVEDEAKAKSVPSVVLPTEPKKGKVVSSRRRNQQGGKVEKGKTEGLVVPPATEKSAESKDEKAVEKESDAERRAMAELVEYKENLIRTIETVSSIEDFRSMFPDFTKNAIRREYLDGIFLKYSLTTDQEKDTIRRRVALLMPELYAAYDKREKELEEVTEAEKTVANKDVPKSADSGEWTVKKLLKEISDKAKFSLRKADGSVETFQRDGDKFITTAKKPAKADSAILRILAHGGRLIMGNEPALNQTQKGSSQEMIDARREREADDEKNIENELLARKEQLLDIIRHANSVAELLEGLEVVHFSIKGDGFLSILKKHTFTSSEKEAYFYKEAEKFLRDIGYVYKNKEIELKKAEERRGIEPTEAEEKIKAIDAEIARLTTEMEKMRAKYVEANHKRKSVFKRLRDIFGKNFEDENQEREWQTEYEKALSLLKDAEIEKLRLSKKTGKDLRKDTEGLLTYFKIKEATNLIEAQDAYRLEGKGWTQKIVNSGRAIGEWYNKRSFKEKIVVGSLVTLGVAGVGLAGGGVLFGSAALFLKKVIASAGLSVTFDAKADKATKERFEKESWKEINVELERLFGKEDGGILQMSQEETLNHLNDRLSKYTKELSPSFNRLVSERKLNGVKGAALGFGIVFGGGAAVQYGMNELGGHAVVDWAKGHLNTTFGEAHTVVSNTMDQISGAHPNVVEHQLTPTQILAANELATPLDPPVSIFPESGTEPNVPSASAEDLNEIAHIAKIDDFVNGDIDVKKGDSVWKIAGGLADKLGLEDAQRTHFIDALKDQYGDVQLKAGETINFSEHGIDKDFVENALAHAKGLTEGQMASIDANDVKIAEFAASHPDVTLTNESVDSILQGNTADVVSPQPGMNGSGIADLTQSYDGAMEGEAGEVGATPVDTERGNVRSADIQYDRDIVLGKTYNLMEYVDYFNQHPETFTQFQKIDGDYKKFISLGNVNDFQEMKGETIRNLDNLKETPLGKFIEMSRKMYGAKLGMPSAKEKVYEYVTRMAMLGIEHPKGVIRLPQSI